jgi:tripartite-type tricarboxylate transporter receptor subunit TctC
MKKSIYWLSLFVFVFSLGPLCDLANSASAYPRRSISIIVPFSPGGGYDTQARGIASFMKNYFPKKTNVIIRNMPGAGALVATHHVWNSKPNGYKILQSVVSPTLVEQHLSPKEVSFKMSEFEWVGQYQKDVRAMAIHPKLQFKNWNDVVEHAKKKPMLYGGGGLASSPSKEARLISLITKLPIDIANYPGSSGIQAGMARGEVEAVQLNFNSLLRWGDDCKILFIWEDQRHSMIPHIPTALEFGVPENEYRRIMELPVLGTPRALALPPETPPEIVKIVRNAFMQVMKDDKYKAWLKKARQIYGPVVPGEDFVKEINKMNQNVKKNLELLKKLSS